MLGCQASALKGFKHFHFQIVGQYNTSCFFSNATWALTNTLIDPELRQAAVSIISE